MTVQQGIFKTIAYKKQSALGTPATGAGGTLLRRVTGFLNKMKDTYDTDEIVSHQQDTGVAYLTSKTQGEINGALSAGSYAPWFASLMRATAFTAGVAISSLTITIAGAGPTYTLTRSAGSYLTDGYKLGDVVRITAGTYTGTARDLNLVVTALTATIMTVVVANGKTLTAQGPIASSTITVMNKKAVVPSSAQANDYYSIEEWAPDTTRSRLYTDVQVASADISIPPNQEASIKFSLLGLARSLASSQQLTSPSAAPSTSIIGPPNAVILLNAAQTVVATSASIKIDGQLQHGEPVIGSKTISDIVKGDIKVGGTVSVLKTDETYATLFDNETVLGIVAAMFVDTSDTSDFVSFNIPRVKLTTEEIDDGKKQIIATMNFVAEYNSAGGASASTDTGIITIQDSQA